MRCHNTSTLARKTLLKWVVALTAIGLLACLCLAALALHLELPDRLTVLDSQVVEFSDGTAAHVSLAPDDRWRLPTRLENIDGRYISALLRLEDKRFYTHYGVDPLAVARSTAINIKRRAVVTGASTITMQLVRLLEPRPRTLRSKMVEAFRAVQLELRMSKREILENYLRFLPFGRNIEGVETAALVLFGHTADALSPSEVATLLAIPQAPTSRHPGGPRTGVLKRSRDKIAKRLLALGAMPRGPEHRALTDEHVLDLIKATPPPDRLRALPRYARHAAVWLLERYPDRQRIRSTLDRGLQTFAEDLMSAAGARLRGVGIRHGACVLLEHDSGAIRGLVGSFDFDDPDGGQIPGFAVPRSPGSTLKPVVYAQAIDRGLALPSFLVNDRPRVFGSYTPTNFDGRHRGLVRLKDALSASLNVPFVDLLAQITVPDFIAKLRSMGATSLKSAPGAYGLSAAIGGVELTPVELAGVYGALAQGGLSVRPRIIRDDGQLPDARVFSAGSAWLTRRALSLRDRPDFPSRRAIAAAPPAIHWKTGTSAGHRDAWAAGSGPTYTAVIWLGNFDRRSSAALVGGKAAGPILFDLLEGVSTKADKEYVDQRPHDLVRVKTCANSGYPYSTGCQSTSSAWALMRQVPTVRDPFNRLLGLEGPRGQKVSLACSRGPSSLLGDPRQTVGAGGPTGASVCHPMADRAPIITSPAPGQDLVLVAGAAPERQQLRLKGAAGGIGNPLSWFVNGRHIAPDESGRHWWVPSRGSHRVMVQDTDGRMASRRFIVH